MPPEIVPTILIAPLFMCLVFSLLFVSGALAQSVCLPSPRLLTTMPMGGQAGTEVSVTIAGDFLEDVEQLYFSDPRIVAVPARSEVGGAANRFLVRIAADTPADVYEARVMTRLGLSSSRAFSIGTIPEVVCEKPNTSLETAMPLSLDSICNSVMTLRSIDHYRVDLTQGQRMVVDCSAGGIDSKLKPVLIVADEQGRDMVVQRRGNPVSFMAPKDGSYVIKVHDLTFQGGPYYFYRLALRSLNDETQPKSLASTRAVNSFSWPPAGMKQGLRAETPSDGDSAIAKIELPCDISGSFYPAADVDSFEFTAAKGEVWWIEVASERLGLPTDPAILVQHVASGPSGEVLTDVVELADIASPVRPSSNAYAYDGPPYNAGSSDILGKLEIKEDGLHRLQIRDLFGGTRNDPGNVYRLIIRKAEPDFCLVAWALHLELRNGDRSALSKPISLRGGATMALEVVAVRRDGFDGPIELAMSNLPEGVTASGLTIPAGESKGHVLLTAADNAPRGFASAIFVGRAQIDGQTVERPCRLASMAWPVPDSWQEIPSPRLLADVPVSVSGNDLAPLTLAAAESKVWEVEEGQSLTIPLKITRRSEFLGTSTDLKTLGAGFSNSAVFALPLDKDSVEAKLDLEKLKTPPGEYTIAFYGSAVAKYAHNPGAVLLAESALEKLQQTAAVAAAEAQRLSEIAAAASTESKADAQQSANKASQEHQAILAEVAEATKRVQAAVAAAKPNDIVDIIVSEPITIRVKP
ncbi:MAG: serine protease, partial [Planctomycetales bacterium]|nr:serine protease [Planctomycetales bacterium]